MKKKKEIANPYFYYFPLLFPFTLVIPSPNAYNSQSIHLVEED